MDIQRIRNLTTGILHTNLLDVHEDVARLTGVVILKREMPFVIPAMREWLRRVVEDERFFDVGLCYGHVGEIDMPRMSILEKGAFLGRLHSISWQLALMDDPPKSDAQAEVEGFVRNNTPECNSQSGSDIDRLGAISAYDMGAWDSGVQDPEFIAELLADTERLQRAVCGLVARYTEPPYGKEDLLLLFRWLVDLLEGS